MNATAQAVGHKRLTVEDLRTFDDEATRLVFDMQDAGWTGYLTNRGHAFMLAPDGTTTASVSRESLRGRSGRNARAQLTRWLRTRDQAAEKAEGRSFGEVQFDLPGIPAWDGVPLTTGTLVEMKRNEAFQSFMREHHGSSRDCVAFVTPVDPQQRNRAWAAFDVRHKGSPRLLALGSALPEATAWELLYVQHPDQRVAQDTSTTSATHTPEDQAMKVYVCKHCDAQFDSWGNLGVHSQTDHGSGKQWVCDHEGCGKPFGTAGGLNLHRNGAHPVEVTCPEEGCGYVTVNRGALARHRVREHGYLTKSAQRAKDKAGEFTVSHTDPREPVLPAQVLVRTSVATPDTDDSVTVTSSSPGEPTGELLMDYLLSSPQGEDAEDLVAKVRAVVAAPIVMELRRLREENRLLSEQNTKLNHDNGELEAKLSILREALSV